MASKKPERGLTRFRVDVSLVIVGLFLALGVQNLIEFFQTLFPHISAFYYLGLGIFSILIVIAFLNLAAGYAGIKH